MKILGNVIKSQSDHRLYRAIKLKNEIECLIISDQEAKRSSAALSVGVGSLQDPLEAQGLAHYLQHMLFMGTKKYPNENDYSNFIAKNSGQSNAYTSQQETNYHFEVASNAFPETLDRFAQFFISPLMSDSSSQRELNAVHSEHSKNILNDSWRKFQLTKYLAKKHHPYSKFSTGNKQSLSSSNLRQMLHEFYDKNYSSNLMKLVVCGSEHPDDMSRLVEEKFSDVPNKNYTGFKMSEAPYDEKFFNKMYKVLPVQDRKVLEISWMVSDKSALYENRPAQYVSYILGHEGKGSLLSFLIKEGLALGLSAGGHDSFNCYSQFDIRISLTSKGVENVRQVIEYVLHFVDKVKRSQPERWVFDQLKNVYKMKFDFMEKRQGMSFVSGLAKQMHKRKVDQVLSYPYILKEWKPQLITDYLNQMNRQNMSIFLEAKEVEGECNLVEPIYQTKFSICELHSLQPRVCPAHMPSPNPFIPSDFEVYSKGISEVPTLMHKSERMQVYFKKDHRFDLPKMMMNMRVFFKGNDSVTEYLCRRIYVDMLTEKMRQFTYLTDSAQAYSYINFESYYSMDIGFSGFRDSTKKIVKPYLEQVFAFEPTDAKYFETVKQKLQRSFSNYFLSEPYRLAYNLTSMATTHGSTISPAEKLKQIGNISFQDIVNFSKVWSKKLYVEAFIAGNIEQSEAQELSRQAQTILFGKSEVLPKSQIGEIRAIKLPSGMIWGIEEKIVTQNEQNSAIVAHFQHEASTLRSQVLQDLCYNFIKDPAFDYLRTKQQLGYIVMCLPDKNRGVLGMSILLQSAIKTSYELIQYVDVFLAEVLVQKLKQLNQLTFNQYKQSLTTSKSQKDKNLGVEVDRFWSEITRHQYLFDRKQKYIEQLQKIDLAEFKNFVNLLFYLNPKRLQIHLISQKDLEKNQQLRAQRAKTTPNLRISPDAQTFKKKMDLFPDFYSHL